MNLLVMSSPNRARAFRDVLGLDRGEWYAVGAGESITGIGFDNIVVVEHDDSAEWRAWASAVLHTRLNQGGRITFI